MAAGLRLARWWLTALGMLAMAAEAEHLRHSLAAARAVCMGSMLLRGLQCGDAATPLPPL